MSFTVFLGNLPVWVTADDIKSWLTAEGLVSDNIKVIRNPETQESKGFAFIDAPNNDEMNSIIRRFDRAPWKIAFFVPTPAQPPRSKNEKPSLPVAGATAPPRNGTSAPSAGLVTADVAPTSAITPPPDRNRRGGKKHKRTGPQGPQSAFAEELAKAL